MLVLLIPYLTIAGEIYGSIKKGRKPLGKDVPIEIKIGDKEYSTKTDRYGSYRIFVMETGNCTLTVKGTKSSPSIQISSYKNSIRYDLVLLYEDKKWFLKRK